MPIIQNKPLRHMLLEYDIKPVDIGRYYGLSRARVAQVMGSPMSRKQRTRFIVAMADIASARENSIYGKKKQEQG